MEIWYLLVVFAVIVLLLGLKRPLWVAILGGLAATALLYRIPLPDIGIQVSKVFTQWGSLSVLVSMYLITYLQRMLEARSQIKLAAQDLNGLFHNRRVNVIGSALFIGMLPSAAAMILCGDIIKEATDGYLNPREQAFVTSWFRHIPESSLPTYASVLLMSSLAGVELPGFMLGMIIPIAALIVLGSIPYMGKLPRDPGTPKSTDKKKDALSLAKHLWSLGAVLVLILGVGLSVVEAVGLVILLCWAVYRFSPKDMGGMVVTAFEKKLLLNTFLVLVLKEFISYTGVLALLPEALGRLPIPPYLCFGILFFLGGIISGSSGIIAMGTPLAFSALPGGAPFMVFLMGMTHAASQVAPTHVCLVVASDYYGISLGQLIRKTLPATIAFCIFMVIYYNILLLF